MKIELDPKKPEPVEVEHLISIRCSPSEWEKLKVDARALLRCGVHLGSVGVLLTAVGGR